MSPVPKAPNGTIAALDYRMAGVVAGLVAALASGAPLLGSPILAALYFFSCVPIFFAGFSHGPYAAVIAAAVASIAVGAFGGPIAGLVVAATATVPAAYAAWLANLARPAEELGGPSGGMAWYPLADILLHLCLTVAAGTVVVGIVIGYSADLIRPLIDATLDELVLANPEQFGPELASEEARATTAGLVAGMLPIAQPYGAVLVLTANLYLAMVIARASGLMPRPRDDMAIALRMPQLGLALFAVTVVLAFLGGVVGTVGGVFAGALAAGFTIAGFAMFHMMVRGRPGRGLLLVSLYLLTAFFYLPALAMLALGLFSSARAVPVSKRKD